jgi:ABC-type nitrate/sulfonate/bicarbonate transport system permease component
MDIEQKVAGSEQTAKGTVPKRRSEWREGKYLSVLSVLLYLVIWFAITEEGFAIVPSIFFPSPLMVIEAAINLSTILVVDVLVTLARVAVGLSAGIVLGIGLGLLMSFNKKIYYFFDPLIESMRPVPVIAMIPFFLLWFGINETGKILLVMLGVFAIMVVNTVESIRNIPKIYTQAAVTLGASKWDVYRRVILPGIVPGLIGPLRVSLALSFTLVVAAEFMGAQAGLGYRILEARRLFNTDVILLGIVLFGVMSGVLDQGLRKLMNHITRWSERSAENE